MASHPSDISTSQHSLVASAKLSGGALNQTVSVVDKDINEHLSQYQLIRQPRLTFYYYLLHSNKIKWNIIGKVQLLVPYHQQLPLILWVNIIK